MIIAMTMILNLFQLLVLLFGFLPSIFIELLYDLWVVVIIGSVVIIYYAFVYFDKQKIITGFGTIIFSFLSHLCWLSNHGTDGGLGGLYDVANAVGLASFFSILTFICFIKFVVMVMEEKKFQDEIMKNKNNLPSTQNQIVVNTKKCCIFCGNMDDSNNKFCTNCGKKYGR